MLEWTCCATTERTRNLTPTTIWFEVWIECLGNRLAWPNPENQGLPHSDTSTLGAWETIKVPMNVRIVAIKIIILARVQVPTYVASDPKYKKSFIGKKSNTLKPTFGFCLLRIASSRDYCMEWNPWQEKRSLRNAWSWGLNWGKPVSVLGGTLSMYFSTTPDLHANQDKTGMPVTGPAYVPGEPAVCCRWNRLRLRNNRL